MRLAFGFLIGLFAGPLHAETVEVTKDGQTARFEAPTHRYGHGIMGDLPEWGRLCLDNNCVTLPERSVFEDIAPRLADIDGDGRLDAVVVESSVTGGAALVVYRHDGARLVRVSTPEIGRRNRWLAPVGVADFDDDGRMDIAYVETPHLGKVLKIVSWDDGVLRLRAKASGLSNHRIGDEVITSGIRNCVGQSEIVLPNGNWTRVFSGRFDGGELVFESLGRFPGIAELESFLRC